jgi:hypothetical protein
MSTPRNDALARLIAPQLVGAMDVETAQDLLTAVEQLAVHKATAALIERCQQHGHLSTLDVLVMLGDAGVQVVAPPQLADWSAIGAATADPSDTAVVPLPQVPLQDPFGTDSAGG